MEHPERRERIPPFRNWENPEEMEKEVERRAAGVEARMIVRHGLRSVLDWLETKGTRLRMPPENPLRLP